MGEKKYKCPISGIECHEVDSATQLPACSGMMSGDGYGGSIRFPICREITQNFASYLLGRKKINLVETRREIHGYRVTITTNGEFLFDISRGVITRNTPAGEKYICKYQKKHSLPNK